MAIVTSLYAVYERLASAKMNAMVTEINAHTHDGVYGVKINFNNIAGTLTATQIQNNTITGDMLVNQTITNADIYPGTITLNLLDLTTIHLNNAGYAVYSP
jgi:hypothetical protein